MLGRLIKTAPFTLPYVTRPSRIGGRHQPCRLLQLLPSLRRKIFSYRSSSQAVAMDSTNLIRLVLIGDVHGAWDPGFDPAALKSLSPDAVLFVGDFGEEVVDLIADIAAIDMPKAIMLGNHDAWGPLYLGQSMNKVERQLKLLGKDHVAYSSKRFKASSGQYFSVVGGRPFSDGNSSMDEVTERLFGPQSMSESAELIREKIVGQAEGEPIILMAHNGPQGLGSRRHDPCGKDFRPTEGDYGDPDLRMAIDKASANGRHPALVTFGHMHQSLHKGYGAGRRNMVHIDEQGIVYLNCAVVSRHRRVSGRGNRVSHFVVVELEDGAVLKAENVWLSQSGDGNVYAHNKETLIDGQVTNGILKRTITLAFDQTHKEIETRFTRAASASRSQREL